MAYAGQHRAAFARSRALSRLADLYPSDYDRLYAEEAEAVGVTPRRKPVAVFNDGSRSCALCSTVLSRYNPHRLCASCARKKAS